MSATYAAGRVAWPAVELSPELFQAHLDARGLGSDADNAAELYLACACLHQLPAALRSFETAYLAHLPKLLARLRPTPELVDEVGQRLREKLFVGAAPKIAEYSGKGALMAWLRVVAVRVAIDLKRASGDRDDPLHQHSLATSAASPELQALRNRYRPYFKRALGGALENLTSEQRLLLKLHFVDGLSMEELGRLLKVNRSTVFRRLGVCVEAILERIRTQLGDELGVTTAELQSLGGLLQSDLELSLADHLKSRA